MLEAKPSCATSHMACARPGHHRHRCFPAPSAPGARDPSLDDKLGLNGPVVVG